MPVIQIPDAAIPGWHLELRWKPGETVMQLATVNPDSPFAHDPATDPDQAGPFTGWRVSLDKRAVRELALSLARIDGHLAGGG